MQTQIDSVFSKYQFNGSVSVIKNDEILYQKENGFEDFNSKKKLDENSVFAIASLSKQFTAALVLLQEDQGKLSTEDQVSTYLSDFQTKEFQNITIQQLLNHTSGLSDFGNGLHSKPGEKFKYSNKGFRLLGEIIEKVSGKSYDENVQELFEKVRMKNSFTANNFNGKNFASAFTGNSKNFQEVENMPKRLAKKEISVPAGGILSTVSDLHLWNSALYSGKILKPASLKKFMEKSSDRKHQILGKMGYGFGIMMNLGKPEAYFHTGYVKGSPSLNIYYPETQTSVIILSNIADKSKGKFFIFKPHKEIKQITDAIQISIIELKKDLLKKNSTE
ncbi:serine hydrolase domain-containing protein [Frigoriflavimonas asaccharolytica]|uniref:CubicO group peptidase (Beta-lactamase class C family) n=1 Tax=Frigoriflavimonas asaccharolytica TaxID=2735899 RepID=A0A8J8G944_9FLAO|nr:serine hydrolase domain-containing protein [Frigoriflavimonas asaccharolytica]NRS93609.1 CubicO group peptidase (beta-lactamase class C family) [Frigoriflavimonas asaccharolytica]